MSYLRFSRLLICQYVGVCMRSEHVPNVILGFNGCVSKTPSFEEVHENVAHCEENLVPTAVPCICRNISLLIEFDTLCTKPISFRMVFFIE